MNNSTRPLIALVLLLTIAMTACAPQAVTSPPAPEATTAPATAAAPSAIVHQTKPGTGTKQEANAHDNDESKTYQDKDVQTGDQFNVNRFERPFTSKDMDYLPYVDIKDLSMSSDDTWYYVQIVLVGLGKGNKTPKGTYGAEFDLDMDGKAEILILASPPFSSDWSTDGVAVYFDQNGDIGGTRMYPDDNYTGDGYEMVFVNSGVGNDPDLAWAHFVMATNPVVELAFKRSMFKDTDTFLWDVLASANPVDPKRMYYNDTISLAKAGSPSKANKSYPLKQLWGLDNTCRVPFGFQATGTEPMGCDVSYAGGGGSDPNDITFNVHAHTLDFDCVNQIHYSPHIIKRGSYCP